MVGPSHIPNLKAILVGVKLAWSRGFTRIRVVLMHPCYNVVQGIHEVHSGSGNIIWNNILKEANQVDLQRNILENTRFFALTHIHLQKLLQSAF